MNGGTRAGDRGSEPFPGQNEAPECPSPPSSNLEPQVREADIANTPDRALVARSAGPFTFEEAIALARQYLAAANEPGLEGIPDYVHLVVSDDNVPEDAYACYLWLGELPEDAEIRWEDCLHDRTRKLPVRIRSRVLESDEAVVAVIAHELYEIVHLRAAFVASGDVLTPRQVSEHISYDYPGNLHYQAVAFGDRLVRTMRGQ